MRDPETGVVGAQSLALLSASYVAVQDEVRKLSCVDLNELITDEDKICFFTNVLNTLLVHALITEATNILGHKGNSTEGENSEGHNSATVAALEKHLPKLGIPYSRTAYLKKYGYNIGQLGFVRYVLFFAYCTVVVLTLGALRERAWIRV